MSATRSNKQHRVNGDTALGQHVAEIQKAKDAILEWIEETEAAIEEIKTKLEEII